MIKSHRFHWGWGIHIDLDGNLRDAFPPVEKQPAQAQKAQAKWHVKKRMKTRLAQAH